MRCVARFLIVLNTGSWRGMLDIPQKLQTVLPWVAGAGLAASHTLMASNCTLPKNGQCTTCGSCSVVVVTLVSWALLKRDSSNKEFNESDEDRNDSCF